MKDMEIQDVEIVSEARCQCVPSSKRIAKGQKKAGWYEGDNLKARKLPSK